jgi:hypothetical protein
MANIFSPKRTLKCERNSSASEFKSIRMHPRQTSLNEARKNNWGEEEEDLNIDFCP